MKKGNKILSIPSKRVFEDDQYLLPILADDALLFSLDEVTSTPANPSQDIIDNGAQGRGLLEDSTCERLTELHNELDRVKQQFGAYREAVDKTLECRWSNQDSGPGLSEGNAQQFETADRLIKDESHYFTSYSYNGWLLREVRCVQLMMHRDT